VEIHVCWWCGFTVNYSLSFFFSLETILISRMYPRLEFCLSTASISCARIFRLYVFEFRIHLCLLTQHIIIVYFIVLIHIFIHILHILVLLLILGHVGVRDPRP
jgi:hypothetical protein